MRNPQFSTFICTLYADKFNENSSGSGFQKKVYTLLKESKTAVINLPFIINLQTLNIA
jgi:hypothetical protein